MRKFSLYEYFYFTRAERNASIVLSVICVVFFALPSFYGYLRPAPPDPDFEEFRKMIAPVIAQMEANQKVDSQNEVAFRGKSQQAAAPELFFFDPNTVSKADLVRLGLTPRTAQTVLNYRNSGGQFQQAEDFKKLYTLRPEDYERLAPWMVIKENEKGKKEFAKEFETEEAVAEVEYFHFDPNTATKDDFLRLGLPSRTAQSIVNYRSKGGHFDKKEDLRKIYTLDSADFERLLPWMEITEKEEDTRFADSDSPKPKFEKKDWSPKPIDINRAGIEEWEQFRGIGPGFAKRIVNYRERLGGFVSTEQVAETYGLADSTFQAMYEYLNMPTGIFRKINVNSASLEELKGHPYLNKSQAAILFNYRKQHGEFQDFESMKKIRAGFKPSDWKRLEPYLSFE